MSHPINVLLKLKKVARVAFVLLLLSVVGTLQAQTAKHVYITLDVSGSMTTDDKYQLANYTAQMIVAMCEPTDEVTLLTMNRDKNLTAQPDAIGWLQSPIRGLRTKLGATENDEMAQIGDVRRFAQIYHHASDKQDFLFIVGDGYWNTGGYPNIREALKRIVASGTLQVCYLQTAGKLSEESDFTQFVRKLGVVDIHKSSSNTSTIKKECNYFTRKMLGFSTEDLQLKTGKDGTVSFVTKMPIEGFVVVYQDDVLPAGLPDIKQAEADGRTLGVKLRGVPSTEKLYQVGRRNGVVSGKVWRSEGTGVIRAGSQVVVTFDQKVKAKNVRIYPIVKQVDFGTLGLEIEGTSRRDAKLRTTYVCRDMNHAAVRLDTAALMRRLPADAEISLSDIQVTVVVGDGRTAATLRGAAFECDIELKDNKTQYITEIDIAGYGHWSSEPQTIEKGECGMRTVEGESFADTMPYAALMRSGTMKIVDRETGQPLNLNDFNITVDLDGHGMMEEPTVVAVGDEEFYIELRPRGEWCECVLPRTLKYTITASPKPDARFDDYRSYKQIESHGVWVVERSDGMAEWWRRCHPVVLTIAALLLLFVYLRLLLSKRRFKQGARIIPKYQTESEMKRGGNYSLRRRGLLPWVHRWLTPWPRVEKRNIASNRPPATVKFLAGESEEVVLMPRVQFDKSKMSITGYNPDAATSKKEKYIKIPNGRYIVIKNNGGEEVGRLIFESGSKKDGVVYRIVLNVLLVLDVLAILGLILLLV